MAAKNNINIYGVLAIVYYLMNEDKIVSGDQADSEKLTEKTDSQVTEDAFVHALSDQGSQKPRSLLQCMLHHIGIHCQLSVRALCHRRTGCK